MFDWSDPFFVPSQRWVVGTCRSVAVGITDGESMVLKFVGAVNLESDVSETLFTVMLT